LQVELESLAGVPVNLLTPGDRPVSSRAEVLMDEQPV